MKITAYQFAVSSDIRKNLETMEKAIREAGDRQTNLVVFPECALTGYPPMDMPSASQVDFTLAGECCERLQELCAKTKTAAVVGMIAKEEERIFNRAVFIAPDGERGIYDKRALWGWDRENFTPGNRTGIIDYRGFRIGIRICFEVRFPEYFRELYRERTDTDLVLFYDASETDDPDRYDLIRGHLRTRAAENACTIISSNVTRPFQTAPSAVFGRSGQVLAECPRNTEGYTDFILEKQEFNFGEQGRAEISDMLLGISGREEEKL